jgi:hypothetical protein
MELYSDSDAPSIDAGVLRRLHRLDPNLAVTWSHWEIDPMTSRPVLFRGRERIKLQVPAYHVWSRNGSDGRWYYVQSHFQFGHREVRALESDCLRSMTPSQILAENRRLYYERNERAKKNRQDERGDIIKENKSRIHDLLFEDKRPYRGGKYSSYAGQGKRTSLGEVRKDQKEDGWVKPEPHS